MSVHVSTRSVLNTEQISRHLPWMHLFSTFFFLPWTRNINFKPAGSKANLDSYSDMQTSGWPNNWQSVRKGQRASNACMTSVCVDLCVLYTELLALHPDIYTWNIQQDCSTWLSHFSSSVLCGSDVSNQSPPKNKRDVVLSGEIWWASATIIYSVHLQFTSEESDNVFFFTSDIDGATPASFYQTIESVTPISLITYTILYKTSYGFNDSWCNVFFLHP